MLSKEDYAVIETLKKRGVYLKDIAEELEVHARRKFIKKSRISYLRIARAAESNTCDSLIKSSH